MRKAATTQPKGEPTILRPEKGVAGNGFNLRTAMGLDDNKNLYCTLRVSLSHFLLLSMLLIIHSVVSGAWQIEQGSIVQCLGVANRRKSLVK